MRAYLKGGLMLMIGIPLALGAERKALYRVTEAKGDTHVRDFFSAAWEPLNSGRLLYADDMVTIGEDSLIRIRKVVGKNSPETITTLTISQPFITRVSAQMERQVKQTRLPKEIAAISGSLNNASGSTETGAHSADFRDAWTKFVAGDPAVPSLPGKMGSGKFFGSGKKSSEGTIQKSDQLREMTVYAPREDEQIFSDAIPKTIGLSWAKPEGFSGVFLLFLWPAGKTKPEMPVAETHMDFYRHPVNEVGKYNFQVETSDHSWESKVKSFSVAFLPNRLESHREDHDGYSIQLNFPPRDYVRINGNPSMSFSWSIPPGGELENGVLELTQDQIEVKRFPLFGLTHTLQLKEGLYKWRVMGTQRSSRSQQKIRSEWRDITIASIVITEGSSVLKALLDAKLSGNVDVDIANIKP